MIINWVSSFIPQGIRQKAVEVIDEVVPEDYQDFHYAGLPIGKMAMTSVAHYLRTDDFTVAPEWQQVYRNFLIGAVVMIHACEAALLRVQPDTVLLMNGRFIPGRVMYELATKAGVNVIAYESALLGGRWHFYRNKLIDYDVDEHWDEYRDVKLTSEEDERLSAYLSKRWDGGGLQSEYWLSMRKDAEVIREELGLRKEKRTAVLFPNITWDSATYQRDIGFRGLMDWIQATIEFFIDHRECELVIRHHPAEVILSGANRDLIVTRISREFSSLPSNIHVVPADSDLSSYTLMDISNVGLVYTSTTGLEMALKGKSVIVAGKVHYRDKGFTLDASSKGEYLSYLAHILIQGKTRTVDVTRARRYAYLSLYRASIPIKYVNTRANGSTHLNLASYKELLPGRDPIIDLLCDGIIEGGNFIHPSRGRV
jgi:hypothetical protein